MIATTTSNSISVKARRFEIRATFDDFPNFLKSGVTTGNQQRSRLREKLARRQPDYGNGFCAFGTDFTGGNTATFFRSFGRCVHSLAPFTFIVCCRQFFTHAGRQCTSSRRTLFTVRREQSQSGKQCLYPFKSPSNPNNIGLVMTVDFQLTLLAILEKSKCTEFLIYVFRSVVFQSLCNLCSQQRCKYFSCAAQVLSNPGVVDGLTWQRCR